MSNIYDKQQQDDVIFLNQRTTPRITAELEVTLSGPHNFFNGFTEDISRGGIFIATHQVYPIGTEFSVTLKIDGKDLNINSKVVWIRENSPTLPIGVDPGMGLNFIDLKPEDLKMIEAFIKKKEPIFFDAEI